MTDQLLILRKMLLLRIIIANAVKMQYCSNCLIPIEGCSWDIEIVCKAGSALLSRTVSLSVRSDKHWTVITPICGCIAQHNPAQSSHAHNTAHQAHLDRKIDSNYEKKNTKKKKERKERERKISRLITALCKLLLFDWNICFHLGL